MLNNHNRRRRNDLSCIDRFSELSTCQIICLSFIGFTLGWIMAKVVTYHLVNLYGRELKGKPMVCPAEQERTEILTRTERMQRLQTDKDVRELPSKESESRQTVERSFQKKQKKIEEEGQKLKRRHDEIEAERRKKRMERKALCSASNKGTKDTSFIVKFYISKDSELVPEIAEEISSYNGEYYKDGEYYFKKDDDESRKLKFDAMYRLPEGVNRDGPITGKEILENNPMQYWCGEGIFLLWSPAVYNSPNIVFHKSKGTFPISEHNKLKMSIE